MSLQAVHENYQAQLRMLDAISRAQAAFIASEDDKTAFELLLSDLLSLTGSEYGFIGEVLYSADGAPYLKTHAITNIAWNDATRKFYEEHAPKGMEFHNLQSLFGAAIVSGKPVIANDPGHDPRRGGLPSGHPPLDAFLGIPIRVGEQLVAMAGMANRQGGYDQRVVDFLGPLLITIGQLVEARRNLIARRETEQALNQFKSTLDQTLDCVFMFDASTLCFFYANQGAQQQVGYDLDELADMHPYDIKPDIAEEAFRALIAPLLNGQQPSITFETFHQHKNGRRLPVEIFLQYIAPEGQPPRFVAIVRDISERRAAEMKVRESEQRFRDMLETCPTAARIALSGGREVVFSNRRYAELINAASGEVTGLDPSSYYAAPADYAAILERLGKGEQVLDYLVELKIPDCGNKWALASYYPIEYEGKPAVLGWFFDITDRKHNETRLREEAQHTQTVIDNMVDGLITIDRKGIIASFNRAAERIFGYSAAEVTGQNVKMLMPQPHRDAHDGYLQNYQSTGVARVIGIGREVEGQRKDGSVFPMELAVSEVTRQGAPLYVGLVRDITERKRVERMKSEFVSTVSHELRTPLTSISGALGLLAGGAMGALPERAHSLVDIAHKNSKRLTHLINDLLDMEKIAAGKMQFDMQPHALIPLVEQALDGIRAYAVERRVSFVLEQQVDTPEVRVDSQRLLQVLTNLLSNAAKYSPEGGTVTVSVRQEARQVRVEVTDHGCGIPQAFRSRIFQKFSQADSSDTRQKGGTGLGLAITKELVERMGGRIGFESEEGQGASFHFVLPLSNAGGVQPADDVHAPTSPNDAPRILVVEDEPDIAKLLSTMLARAGYQVDTAMTGSQAVEALQHTRYAAMTLDLMLPDIGGLEIIRQVRHDPETACLPIVVISAKIEEGWLAINGDLSGIDWLPKPIDEQRLLWSLRRQLPDGDRQPLRILHIEDDHDMHAVIRAMAGESCSFQLATTLADARPRIERDRYDVVLLDLGLPDGSGWDLLPSLRASQPGARIVILSGAEMPAEEIGKVETVLLKSRVSSQDLIHALHSSILQSGHV